MNNLKKKIAIALSICTFYANSAANASIAFNSNRFLIDKYISEYVKNAAQVSKELSEIFSRKALYLPLALEYMLKFNKEGIKYNGKSLNMERSFNLIISLQYVESRGNLKVVSKADAVGSYQLMHDSAKEHNLRIDDYVDERINPKKAARAALNYLSRYSYNKSLDLALLAYNGNPKRVERALRENPNIKDNSEVPSSFLKTETIHFVPKTEAMCEILENPKAYGINLDYKEIEFKVHKTKAGDSLSKLARKYHSSEDLIADYNGLKNKSRIPLNYYLIIPKNY